MMDPKYLDRYNDAQGCACLEVTITITIMMLKYPKYSCGDDSSNDGPRPDKDGADAPSRISSTSTAHMDSENPQSSNSSSHGRTISGGSKMVLLEEGLVPLLSPLLIQTQ
jgi:hypothetical protein